VRGATAWVIAFILLRVLLLAGVAEELIFRGAIHSWLAGRLPAAGTVAVTAALFALEHAYLPVLALAARAVGR
jgi:membrane protease YdiL (CAAX protease family)